MTAQEHVSETLRRAVLTDRVGHAYLFCGPRGIGKTTLARVLAMSLNCVRREDDGEPCGECENCGRIWKGTTSLDVVEIDAASNRGVDDARELRERAMYAPSEEGRSKVYIVDEAHMLTREAWNALLKIIEEPPPGVIFIFATTEPQKIEQSASPILSRCQRFDFRRLGVAEIVGRLRVVLDLEGGEASEEALRLIARRADGGMRDALSLLDQILSLSEGEVTAESTRRVLGLVAEEKYLELFDLLASRDRGGLLRLIEEVIDEGHDLYEFYRGMVEGFRTLLRLRVGGDRAELPEEREEQWRERADRFGAADLVRMLKLAVEAEVQGGLRRSGQPRVLLELLLLRYSYLDRTIELEGLLKALGGEPPPLPDPPDAAAPADAGLAGFPKPGLAGTDTQPVRAESGSSRSSGGNSGERSGRSSESGPEVVSDTEKTPKLESLLASWKRLLDEGEGIPRGLTPLLRGADARVEKPGVLSIRLPPGPGLERLSEPPVLRSLEAALAARTDGHPSIRVEGAPVAGTEGPGRISSDEAKSGRLRDLLEEEPGLQSAVETLDLELLD